MAASWEDLLPKAVDQQKKIALAEAAKAADAASQLTREEAEKKALLDRFSKPSGVDDGSV